MQVSLTSFALGALLGATLLSPAFGGPLGLRSYDGQSIVLYRAGPPRLFTRLTIDYNSGSIAVDRSFGQEGYLAADFPDDFRMESFALGKDNRLIVLGREGDTSMIRIYDESGRFLKRVEFGTAAKGDLLAGFLVSNNTIAVIRYDRSAVRIASASISDIVEGKFSNYLVRTFDEGRKIESVRGAYFDDMEQLNFLVKFEGENPRVAVVDERFVLSLAQEVPPETLLASPSVNILVSEAMQVLSGKSSSNLGSKAVQLELRDRNALTPFQPLDSAFVTQSTTGRIIVFGDVAGSDGRSIYVGTLNSSLGLDEASISIDACIYSRNN